MITATAHLKTDHGSKYLQQLCKHFAHKVAVDYTETQAKCALPPGPATLAADESGLHVTITAQDEKALKTAKSIIDKHLERFAFREGFTVMDWQV